MKPHVVVYSADYTDDWWVWCTRLCSKACVFNGLDITILPYGPVNIQLAHEINKYAPERLKLILFEGTDTVPLSVPGRREFISGQTHFGAYARAMQYVDEWIWDATDYWHRGMLAAMAYSVIGAKLIILNANKRPEPRRGFADRIGYASVLERAASHKNIVLKDIQKTDLLELGECINTVASIYGVRIEQPPPEEEDGDGEADYLPDASFHSQSSPLQTEA